MDVHERWATGSDGKMAVPSVRVVFEAGLPLVRPGLTSPPGMVGEEWVDSTPQTPTGERLVVAGPDSTTPERVGR